MGVFYNLVEAVERGFEQDAISDNAIVDTVDLVTRVLEPEHEVVHVRMSREVIPQVSGMGLDVVFNLCEGFEGRVQGEAWVPALLDILEIPYTGSESFSLALCSNKRRTKEMFIANKLPTPGFQIYASQDVRPDPAISFPMIVKPANEDASVGIDIDSVVYSKADLFRKVDHILQNYRQPALVEEYIDGRELNVAVMGNGSGIEVLPISEIRFEFAKGVPKIVTYQAKWLKDSDEYKGTVGACPVELDPKVEETVRRLAVEAYKITGCRDYARVDLRLRGDEPFVLEVNPNPDIGPDTGFQRSAKAAGMSDADLVRRIFRHALERYPKK